MTGAPHPLSERELRRVRRGPPITLTCDCGERRELRYGDRWQCERCAQRYDTNQIPVDEYAELRRARVRDRIVPTLVFALAAGVAAAFALIGRPFGAVVVVALIAFLWGSFVRPARRRRQYRAIANRPQWNIKAD